MSLRKDRLHHSRDSGDLCASKFTDTKNNWKNWVSQNYLKCEIYFSNDTYFLYPKEAI